LEKTSRKMMRKSIINFLLLSTLLSSTVFAQDSTKIVYDSTKIEVRHFDQSSIDEHKADSDFDYGLRPEAELTLWQRFKIWLKKLLSDIFYFGTTTPIGKIILYILLAAAIIYAVYKLSTIGSRKLFYGENGKGLDYDLYHEDIHEMDFDKLIKEAIQQKNYRLAIRLIYLNALKYLSDQHLIDWQPGKTNFDYVNELEQEKLKPGFNELSYYFDYAWYGDFAVTKNLFEKVNNTFDSWKKELKI